MTFQGITNEIFIVKGKGNYLIIN